MTKKHNGKPSTRRAGLAPDEYLRRSTVYVQRVRQGDEAKRYPGDDLTTEDTYTIRSYYRDGFRHTVEIDGQTWSIPGRVVERLISQREAIDKERRDDRNLARSAAMKGTRPAFLNIAEAITPDNPDGL